MTKSDAIFLVSLMVLALVFVGVMRHIEIGTEAATADAQRSAIYTLQACWRWKHSDWARPSRFRAKVGFQ